MQDIAELVLVRDHLLEMRVGLFLGFPIRGGDPHSGILSLIFGRELRSHVRRFVLIRIALHIVEKYPNVRSQSVPLILTCVASCSQYVACLCTSTSHPCRPLSCSCSSVQALLRKRNGVVKSKVSSESPEWALQGERRLGVKIWCVAAVQVSDGGV